MKYRISKEVKGRILSATVSRNPSGNYYVAICCTDVDITPLPSTGAVEGLDMGIKSFVVSSEGKAYPNHRYLEEACPTPAEALPKDKGEQPLGKGKSSSVVVEPRIARIYPWGVSRP